MNMMTPKIANLEDIKHLIERGSLIKVVYDTEIYNLNKQFPGIYDIGHHIKDLAGNEIGAPVHYLKQPKDALHSLVSNLITRTFPEDHPEAVDFKTFVGKMLQTLDHPYEYTWERYRDEQTIKFKNKGNQKVNTATVRLFPVKNKDGEIEHVRLHEGGKRISYEVPEYSQNYNYVSIDADGSETKWRRTNASAEMRGYANTSADDPWIWPTLYMGLSPEVFKTHTKAENKVRVDVLKAMQAIYKWGPRGEDGIKAGRRTHPVSGKEVVSFKQADILAANTHNEGQFHTRGASMPNRSNYEPDQAHGTKADTQGTSAGEDLLIRADREMYKHFEMLGDPKYAKEFAMKGTAAEPRHFSSQPLRAFIRYDLENEITSHLGMGIETDERYGNRGNLVMVKLNTDWDSLTYQGKKILDIKHKETLKKAISSLLFNKFGKVDSLVEATHLKKTPMLWEGDKALKRGAHSQEEYDLALRNRSKMRKNRNFMEALMEVYEDRMPAISPVMDTPNPLDEQLMFNFVGGLDYFETPTSSGKIRKIRRPEDFDEVMKKRVQDPQERAYYHADLEWEMALKNDHLLHDLIRPHAIEFCSPAESEKELARFNDILSKTGSKIRKYNSRPNTGHIARPSYIIPELVTLRPSRQRDDDALQSVFNDASQTRTKSAPTNQQEAQQYITQLRFQALWSEYNNDQSFRFNDYNRFVEIVDRDGHAMPWEAYDSLAPDECHAHWKNGDFDIRLQKIEGHTTRRLARMMCESGEIDALMQNFAELARASKSQEEKQDFVEKIKCLHHHKALYHARATFMMHGYPNTNPEKQPFLTIARARMQAHEILQNLKMGKLHQAGIDDIGALEFMADHKDEAERICVAYLEYLDRKEIEMPPPTREQYLMLGIDPDMKDPLPHIRYTVDPEKVITLDCPDGAAREPLTHSKIGSTFIIAELPVGMDAKKLQKALDKPDAKLVIAGMKTGERRLAAKAKVMPLWPKDQDDNYSDEMAAFAKHFVNIGRSPTSDRSRLVIIKAEELPLVAGLRGDKGMVDPSLQALNVPFEPRRKTFLAMLSKKLGNVDQPVTGLVLRNDDIKQELGRGPIRIRETDNDGITGREFQHEVSRIVSVNMKKFMAAYEVTSKGAVNMADYDLEMSRGAGFDDKAEMNQYVGIINNHERYGYNTKLEMFDSLIEMFAKNRHKVMQTPEKYNVTIIDLKKETSLNDLRATMVYFDLYNRPHAALEREYDAPGKAQKSGAAKTVLYTGVYPGVSPEHEL